MWTGPHRFGIGGEIVNTLPLTYISRRDGTTAGYQPRKHQATE